MTLRRLIRISRPRFWLYEAGTFAVGAAAAIAQGGGAWSWLLPVWFLFFLIPANVLIYGVNDVYDYETDKKNPKKQGYESVLDPTLHRTTLLVSALLVVPFLPLLWVAPVGALIPFGLFVVCAVEYSAPPIRAKARPVLDSLFSAGHYVATGWFAYALVGGAGVPTFGILAALAWAIAMHAYSAVPDIEADAASGLQTIATWLKRKWTLVFCTVMYVGAIVFASFIMGYVALAFGLPYILLMLSSMAIGSDDLRLMQRYKIFPYLNALVGAILWWLIVLWR